MGRKLVYYYVFGKVCANILSMPTSTPGCIQFPAHLKPADSGKSRGVARAVHEVIAIPPKPLATVCVTRWHGSIDHHINQVSELQRVIRCPCSMRSVHLRPGWRETEAETRYCFRKDIHLESPLVDKVW